MKKLIIVLILVLAGALAAQTLRLGSARDRERSMQTRWDSARAELVADSLRAAGMAAEFATEVSDLNERLAAADDQAQRMAEMFERERIRAERAIRATAAASGQIASVAKPDTVVVEVKAEACEVPQSWTGQLEDGVLAADWQFFRINPRLLLDYRVAIPVELVQATAADGRTLVTGRSMLPNASLTIDSLFVQTPLPVVIERGWPKWVTIASSVLAGYVGYKLRGEKETVIYRDDDDHR